MRRAFWVCLGLGAGAASAIMASRWARRQAERVAPAAIARETKGGLMDLSRLVSESIAEGKRAMAEREQELSATYGEPGGGPTATGMDAPPDAPAAAPSGSAD